MVTKEDIYQVFLQFAGGFAGGQFKNAQMAAVLVEDTLILAADNNDPPPYEVQEDALKNFLREIPNLVSKDEKASWIGVQFEDHTLFVHPRPQENLWIAIWIQGGIENFSTFEAILRQRMQNFFEIFRQRLESEIRTTIECLLFLCDRLASRWGKVLVYGLFWFSLSPKVRRLVYHVKRQKFNQLDLEGVSRHTIEKELDRSLERFFHRLERIWGKEALSYTLQQVFRKPDPKRPSGCLLQRLQRHFPSFQR